MFDLNKIQRERIPDRNGQTIPQSVTSGQFVWSVLTGSKENKLIGRMQIVSKANRASMSYSCESCCPLSFYEARVSPSSVNVLVEEPGGDLLVEERYYINCNGQFWISPWQVGDYFEFSNGQGEVESGDEEIATVSPSSQFPGVTVTGVKEGTTNINVSWEAPQWFFSGSIDACDAFLSPAATSANVTVQCRVPTGETQASAGWITVGQHRWRQTLQPTTVNWAGRRFREVSYAPSTDGCHFQNSDVPHVPLFLPTDTKTLITNQYDDEVGWIDGNAVNYYRVERPARGLPLPCEYNDFQEVEMFCGDVPMPFVRMVLRGVIGQTTITSWRGDQGAGRTWP